MYVYDHIERVETHEDYRGDDPSFPGVYDIYNEYECAHGDCEETYTLSVDLSPSYELVGEVQSHLEREHPEVL